MILYGSSLSPFVRRVLAYASEKGIELESRPVGIRDESPEFRAASPFGKMPAFVDGDYHLADSSAIIHYLEAKYPDPPLIPAAAEARGRVIWFDEFADTILAGCLAKMFFNRVVAPVFMKRDGDQSVADAAERDELPPVLAYLERTVPEQGFLVGEEISLADIAVASPLANLRHMGVGISSTDYPATASYAERILSRPSFAPLLAREAAALERLRAA